MTTGILLPWTASKPKLWLKDGPRDAEAGFQLCISPRRSSLSSFQTMSQRHLTPQLVRALCSRCFLAGKHKLRLQGTRWQFTEFQAPSYCSHSRHLLYSTPPMIVFVESQPCNRTKALLNHSNGNHTCSSLGSSSPCAKALLRRRLLESRPTYTPSGTARQWQGWVCKTEGHVFRLLNPSPRDPSQRLAGPRVTAASKAIGVHSRPSRHGSPLRGQHSRVIRQGTAGNKSPRSSNLTAVRSARHRIGTLRTWAITTRFSTTPCNTTCSLGLYHRARTPVIQALVMVWLGT